MLLEGKRVLVSGGSLGIGRAIVIGAARAGADIAFNYFDDVADAESVVSEVRALGRRCLASKGDVADPQTATAFVAQAVDQLGRVDVFVSNAGICAFHEFLDLPVNVLDRTMRVNLHGAYFMVQAAARQMVAQCDGGAIIAISSISALVGGEFQTHYTPTKAGVLSLMQSAAIALGRHSIRCNAVLPGTIRTRLNERDLADPDKSARMIAGIPLGRLGEPEDIAGPVIFLASDMARYVTGAALLVDGGACVNLQ